MSERTIKIGIIGCGGIANGKHFPALAKRKDVELVAFCDIIEERAQKAAKEYGVENAFVTTNYKELLEIPEIEAVHVLTPNRSHSFITVDALEAGKHVLCEKPMAINSEEAKKMVDAAKRTGKKLTIGYQNRQSRKALCMHKAAEDGKFGDIYYARALALRRRGVPTWGVFLNEYEQGGGPLIDIGTHALDLTLWMMNNYKPKYCIGSVYKKLNQLPVEAQGNAFGPWDCDKYSVEDSAFGFVVMENGATISLESSWALNLLDAHEARTTICGTKGGADMEGGKEDGKEDNVRFNGVENGSQFITNIDLKTGGVAYNAGVGEGENRADRELAVWVSAIKNNTDLVVTPEQAYTVTRILEGIYTSAKTGDIYRF